jgi:hypothetical protein
MTWGFLSPLAGGQDGHFFHILPPYVNPKLPPGCSVLPKPTFMGWLKDALMMRHVWASPNTVWLAIAIAIYVRRHTRGRTHTQTHTHSV